MYLIPQSIRIKEDNKKNNAFRYSKIPSSLYKLWIFERQKNNIIKVIAIIYAILICIETLEKNEVISSNFIFICKKNRAKTVSMKYNSIIVINGRVI